MGEPHKQAQKEWYNDNRARCSLDRVDANNETHYRRLERLLPRDFRSGASLEIGCGGSWYHDKFSPAAGIDISFESIRHGHNAARALVADAEALPVKEGAFSLVYGFAVLHHLADIERGLREAYRVLKPGGLIAFGSENNAACPLNYLFPLVYGNWHIEKGFTRMKRERIAAMLSRIGFVDFRCVTEGFAVYGISEGVYRLTKRLEDLLSQSEFIKNFAGFHYFTARKPL